MIRFLPSLKQNIRESAFNHIFSPAIFGGFFNIRRYSKRPMRHKLVTKYMRLTHPLRLSLLNRHRFIHTGEVLSRGQMGIRAGGARPAMALTRFIVPWGFRCFAAMKRALHGAPHSTAHLKAEVRRNFLAPAPGMEASSDVIAAL